MSREPKKGPSPQALFAAELGRLRRNHDLSQSALGARIGCHRTLLSHIERGEKKPQRSIAEALDIAFKLTEKRHFISIYERMIRDLGNLGWFGRWTEVEQQATSLRFWDPCLVPGFLQTEAYARAIYRRTSVPVSEVEQRVADRMKRRAVLDRKNPPRIWIMMDESVLLRPVGGREVLYEQLRYIMELTENPMVTTQVVPIEAACTPGLLTAFAIARLPDNAQIATFQSPVDGEVTAEPAVLSRLTIRCDTIRDDAYSQSESLRVIGRVMEQWKK